MLDILASHSDSIFSQGPLLKTAVTVRCLDSSLVLNPLTSSRFPYFLPVIPASSLGELVLSSLRKAQLPTLETHLDLLPTTEYQTNTALILHQRGSVRLENG